MSRSRIARTALACARPFYLIAGALFRGWTNRTVQKVRKYEDEFVALWASFLAALVVLLSFFLLLQNPDLLYYEWGFIPLELETTKTILRVMLLLSTIVTGAFLQEVVEFLVRPKRDILKTLNGALFSEMLRVVADFKETLDRDPTAVDEKSRIVILLSYPILLQPDDLDELREDWQVPLEFEALARYIFESNLKFERSLVCLDPRPRPGGPHLHRFVKCLAGFVASFPAKGRRTEPTIRQRSRDLRRALLRKAESFLAVPSIRRHTKFSRLDDLQWQAILVEVPRRRVFRAVVGFYGEDFFRQYSSISGMGEFERVPEAAESSGFCTDAPEVVDWVYRALVAPYAPEETAKEKFELCGRHHAERNARRMFQDFPATEVSEQVIPVMRDSGGRLGTTELLIERGPKRILRDLEYPMYSSNGEDKAKVLYCQNLYHPLVAESSLWSSETIRLPGAGDDVRVLDMCCGIGVQGLAALDRGASEIHGVDSCAVSLVCAAENYRRRAARLGREIIVKLTLADGFKKVQAGSSDEFADSFSRQLREWKSQGRLTESHDTELRELLERNSESIRTTYTDKIPEKYFDLILLEPPFVEFSLDSSEETYGSLYDRDFQLMRELLGSASGRLRSRDSGVAEWERPFIQQSFSSLENVDEFERYLAERVKYRTLRKFVVEKNDVLWYSYHLAPRES